MSNENKDMFANSTERIDSAKATTKYIFSNFLNYILLVCTILFQVILSFFYFTFRGLQDDFWLFLLLNLLCSMIAFWIFIPQGKRNETKMNKNYISNCNVWSSLSTSVQKKCPRKFNEYCKEQTEAKRQMIIQTYISNALIDKETWEKLNELDEVNFNLELKRKNEHGYIYTNNQIKWLKKAKKPIKKVKRIDPCLILTGASYNENGEVGTTSKISYELQMTIQRIATTVAFITILTMVVIQPYSSIGWQAVAECIIRIFGIIGSAVMGFYTGVSAIRIRNSMIKKNINFIQTFNNGMEVVDKEA